MARFYKETPSEIENADEAVDKICNVFNQSYVIEKVPVSTYPSTQEMRTLAYKGELSAIFFRSICWRMFLNVLPEDKSKWLSDIRSSREKYEDLRSELMVSPESQDGGLDPSVNNPLSQNEESPWNQYFEDSELKDQIRLDVKRTFPEVEYFQSKKIQDLMVLVLFCYARKYPDICYMQGMHEILAPLVFALNHDHRRYENASSAAENSLNYIAELMDQAYLEHDAYILFEVVMEKLRPWYETGDQITLCSQPKVLHTQPFARPQDIGPTTKIVKMLTRVHDLLLRKIEPELFAHLCRLEIPPQVYGIRWARLMFGREFPFCNLLSVWDVIFADASPDFTLVEYLMVAMLSIVKEKLLEADYVTVLNLLMRYDSPCDVQYVLQMALYFKNPKVHRPPNFASGFAYVSTVGEIPSIHRAPPPQLQPTQAAHGVHTRSSSLPRHSAIVRSTAGPGPGSGSKYRSTSVDQNGRLKTEVDPARPYVANQNGADYGIKNSSTDESKSPDRSATKLVSGLAKLGERLGRTRDVPLSQPEKVNVKERPMDDLRHLPRTAPVPTPNLPLSGGERAPSPSASSGHRESTAELYRARVEIALSVSSRSADKLAKIRSDLLTRLLQLRVQSDSEVREALEQISEVIEVLRALSNDMDDPSRSDLKTPPTLASGISGPNSFEVISHPLMEAEDS